MHPHRLRDDQWNLIKDGLPGRAGSVGVTAADNRRFVDAVLHRYRTGIPWRDLPESLGDWNNTPFDREFLLLGQTVPRDRDTL
jgi:transposase